MWAALPALGSALPAAALGGRQGSSKPRLRPRAPARCPGSARCPAPSGSWYLVALPGVFSSHRWRQPPESACAGQALESGVTPQPVVQVCSPPASMKFRCFRAAAAPAKGVWWVSLAVGLG